MQTVVALAIPFALLIAYLAARPSSPSADLARRARRVSRNPALVNLGDVQARLVVELPASYAAFARERISAHRIEARTLWTWLDRHGAESLVVFLAAGRGHAAMIEVLCGGTAYDDAELRALAGLRVPELFELAA